MLYFRKNDVGITLIECLIFLALLGILGSVAAVNWGHLFIHNRLQAIASQLQHAIYTTRALAITHNEKVMLCPVGQNQQCGDNWSEGYLIRDNNNVWQHSQFAKIKLSWRSSFGKNDRLIFRADGFSQQTGSFYVTAGHYVERLIVSFSGRVIVSKGTVIRLNAES